MAKSDVLVRMKADTQGYDANIAKARRQLNQFKQDNLSAGGVLKQLNNSLLSAAAGFASVTAAIGAATAAIKSNIDTARGFEQSMAQLSSLTGMVGKDLEQLKEYAIELGSTTTLSASQVADAFKMIGSQQPQLLSSGKALKEVTQYAIRLSEAAGIELSTAAQTLSTSINQMGGDSNNAARYVNVLAAASQKGAGDIAWLGEALTKSATAAKAVGTDYEELVANLEQLAKAGFDASTAGTALRSIIMNLEKQANGDFKPSVVGLTTAFENLGKAQLTISDYQGLVGKQFATQAMSLANAAGEARNMTEAITGTNTAEEQAATNTATLDGSLKALSSAWEGLNLHINSSNGAIKVGVDLLTDVVRQSDMLLMSLNNLTGGFDIVGKTIKFSIETAFNPILNKLLAINALVNKLNGQPAKQYGTGKARGDERGLGGNPIFNGSYSTPENNPITGGSPKVEVEVEVETDNATKSIKELQAEIKKLKQLRDEAADTGDNASVEQYNLEIKAIQEKIKAMRGGSGTSTVKTVDGGVKGLGDMADVTIQTYESMASLRQQLDKYKKALDNATNVADEMAARQGIADTSWKMSDEGRQAAKIGWDKSDLQEQAQQMKEALEEGIGKIEVGVEVKPIDTSSIKDLDSDSKSAAKAVQTAAQATSTLGSAVSAIEDPTAKIIALVAQGIAGVMAGAGQAMAAKDTTESGYAWIGAAATIIAEAATIAAQIHSISGYERGGIVGGNSYSGDNVFAGNAWVNSGELVLTKAQQNSLAATLQETDNRGGFSGTPYVTGENILLGLNNHLRRIGRGEIVTSKG